MGSRQWLGLAAILALLALLGALFVLTAHKAYTLGKPLPTTPKGENQRGLDYRRHYAQADSWFRKAATQGYARAEFNLGVAYDNGQGVPQNYTKAVYWYRKAATQGYARAENNLGVAYNKGRGVPQNYQKAMFWYKKAANQGSAKAEYDIAHFYRFGLSVSRNYVDAYMWYSLAKAAAKPGGNVYNAASDDMQRIGSQKPWMPDMTPAEIVRAQAMAAAWERAHLVPPHG